ncbi:MAG: carboxypeptidase-like regulatory domain-containing protein [Bacteroidota bacterium]|nr:carboxypeptidase-like regulatory domain-containing protein [Bacteroidota bacterium]
MIKKHFISALFLIFGFVGTAQKATVSGYIEDRESGERLLGASVYNPDNTIEGTVTNDYGFFSLTIPKGKRKLKFSYIGYTTKIISVDLVKDTMLTIQLPLGNELEEVVIQGESKVESSQMSEINIPVQSILKMPVLLGETDVLKAVQLLPGVQSGTEGTSGFYVRGGGPDQNLILLDGVPVYNVNHLFGFFSVFNGYAINDITLIKGGFPARYGGRLSSVLDIKMKEGNMKKFRGEASIGIIASKISLEGPIIKDKTSFIVSARRTYIDLLALPIMKIASSATLGEKFYGGYYFYDVNAKVNHRFSRKDRLYLSAYLGKDKGYAKTESTYNTDYYKSNFDLHWGNVTSAVRWNHIFSPKLFSNLTFTYSDYLFVTDIYDEWEYTFDNQTHSEEWAVQYLSGIEDLALKADFNFLPTPRHNIKYGASAIYHTFKPGVSSFRYVESDLDTNIDTTFGSGNLNGIEFSAYFEDDFKIGRFLKFNVGGHLSGFNVGDTTYYSFQPRISGRVLINRKLSAKASYVHMTQYLHFLTNSSIGLPTDLWLPATDRIAPQHSVQYSAGLAYNLTEGIDITVEGFYKEMKNLIAYEEGAGFFSETGAGADENWEDKIEIGQGWAYGGEFMIQKKYGKFNGWIGYTLSWTDRQFENIAFGQKYPYRYDRRHDISLSMNYEFNDRVNVGVTWVYGTGNAVTLATQRYMPVNSIADLLSQNQSPYENYYYYNDVEYYGTRNNFRLPAYHRLDIGVNLSKEKKHGTRTLSLGLYNAYNQKNPFFVDFNGGLFGEYSSSSRRQLIKYSLFPIIPSLTYSYKLR